MAIHIENLNIEQFRGIQQLSVTGLNHINLITGDNNCGKSSLLEALLLLRNPNDFTNTLRVSRMRNSLVVYDRATPYESLLALFPHHISSPETVHKIQLQARCHGSIISYLLQGRLQTILLDPEEQHLLLHKNSLPSECRAFCGELRVCSGIQKEQQEICFHEFSSVSGRSITDQHILNIVCLSPFDHLRGGLFSRILANESYKNLCISILQLFDSGITDLLLLKNKTTNRPVEYVRHKVLGNMPLSSYGDGIKKVLSIASGIAEAVNGILLIDEVETAIHSRHFDEIFRFIVSACRKFHVQVFITSHSMEAIDGFLSIQDYAASAKEDPVSIVTLKKDMHSCRSYARVLSGHHVRQNREQFGFEVRL